MFCCNMTTSFVQSIVPVVCSLCRPSGVGRGIIWRGKNCSKLKGVGDWGGGGSPIDLQLRFAGNNFVTQSNV